MPLLKSQGFYLDLNSFAASNRVTKERRSFKYNYNNLSENKLGRLFWSVIVIFTAALFRKHTQSSWITERKTQPAARDGEAGEVHPKSSGMKLEREANVIKPE